MQEFPWICCSENRGSFFQGSIGQIADIVGSSGRKAQKELDRFGLAFMEMSKKLEEAEQRPQVLNHQVDSFGK